MRRALIPLIALVAAPALAERPWEARIDLPVPVPLELPAVPPTNPFAAPLVSPASPVATPLRAKFPGTVTALASAYVNTDGSCRRVVFTRLPWPALGDDLRPALAETRFTPARAAGAAVGVWLPLSIDLRGRVDQGKVLRLQPSAPSPEQPPVPEAAAPPAPDPRDLELPATPLDRVDQLPSPKRFRARVDSRVWRQSVRLLAEVSAEGRVQRVVFLGCPEGLRQWLLASMASWTFQPAAGKDGPLAAWVQLEGEVEVEMGDQASDALRVMREGWSPRAAAAGAGGPPRGE